MCLVRYKFLPPKMGASPSQSLRRLAGWAEVSLLVRRRRAFCTVPGTCGPETRLQYCVMAEFSNLPSEVRLSSGSQELCSEPKPSHFTRQ